MESMGIIVGIMDGNGITIFTGKILEENNRIHTFHQQEMVNVAKLEENHPVMDSKMLFSNLMELATTIFQIEMLDT